MHQTDIEYGLLSAGHATVPAVIEYKVMKKLAALCLLLIAFASLSSLQAQSRARRVAGGQTPPPTETRSATPPSPSSNNQRSVPEPVRGSEASEEVGEDEVVKVNTTLVTIPVSVMDRDGKFIPYLRQDDFRLYEDGAEQEIAYFGATDKPFTVALVIDTSRSTSFKLEDMQAAAIAFVDQLRDDDRVMVLSFDDRLEILSEPTNDRARLRQAIRETSTGGGTRLYDAVDFVINKRFNNISGRKAIVLFTDGVDTTSKRASYESTVRDAEELDALIYSVQYDTYAAGSIFGGGNGGGWPPPRRRGGLGGILNFPMPFPVPYPVPGGRGGGSGSRVEHDRGSAYLNDLALKTGARVSRADSLQSIERSFALIAEELRRQYSIGYYPKKVAQAGERRQIKVRTREPNLVVRTRDSYITGTPAAVATQQRQQKQSQFN